MMKNAAEGKTKELALFSYIYERQNKAIEVATRQLDASQNRVKQLLEAQKREVWLMESDSLGIAASSEGRRGARAYRKALKHSVKEFVADMLELNDMNLKAKTGADAMKMIYDYYDACSVMGLRHRSLSKMLKMAYKQYVAGVHEQIEISTSEQNDELTTTLQKNLIKAQDQQKKLYLFGMVRN